MEKGILYLCLPSSLGKSIGKSLNLILDCIRGKFKGWKHKFINQAGKEILIKAVVQAIPSFSMVYFLIPKYICEEINSLIPNFWWGGDGDSKRIYWKTWATYSKPKINGG